MRRLTKSGRVFPSATKKYIEFLNSAGRLKSVGRSADLPSFCVSEAIPAVSLKIGKLRNAEIKRFDYALCVQDKNEGRNLRQTMREKSMLPSLDGRPMMGMQRSAWRRTLQ